MQDELDLLKEQAHKSNNKITLQQQILIEKQAKMEDILNFALQVISGMTQRKEYNAAADNYFYFQGNQSGLNWQSQKSQTAWPFPKGYTALIKFRCLAQQQFDTQNLPVLFSCFAESYGGFECYINPAFQVIYRVLPKVYSPPTLESNGVKVADLALDQWNVLVIEHDKPYLARAQLIAILNDKQAVNLPVDYPKFDQKAQITRVQVCSGITSHLGYFALFKEHFSHLKKFVSQLLKLDNFDEIILKNQIALDQYFSDQNSSNQSVNFHQKIFLLYSPLRVGVYGSKRLAFQSIQPKENQYSHQIQDDLCSELLPNSGVHINSQEQSQLDVQQLLPFLEIALTISSSPKQLVNLWLKVVSNQMITDQSFIESTFHTLSAHQNKDCLQADTETVSLLSEILNQLMTRKNKQLHHTFFKCLLWSADFWVNQSYMNPSLNEQYWLLIKSVYASNPIEYNQLSPIHTLIGLMSEIGKQFTQNCCEYHTKSSKLLVSQKKNETQGEFLVVDIQFEVVGEQAANSINLALDTRQASEVEAAKPPNFFPEASDKESNWSLQKQLEPISGVLEAILNSECGASEEIVAIVKYMILSLSSSQSTCPCFQIQILTLLKMALVDSQHQAIFAKRFINENGLQVLLYVCSIALTFDVKAMCVKLIDVLCSRHTSLIKMLRIDTDLITYLGEILIPKNLLYDIDQLQKKRYLKLKNKREAEEEKKRLYYNDQVQIVDYQEDRCDNRDDESAPQRSRNEVELNSIEQRQLDQLFGDAEQEAKDNSSSNEYQQENNLLAKRFEEATGGLKIPTAPKSKVVPKFDFDDGSDSENSQEEIKLPRKVGGAFNFGLDMSDDDSPALVLPTKSHNKYKNQNLLQSQKLPGLKEFGLGKLKLKDRGCILPTSEIQPCYKTPLDGPRSNKLQLNLSDDKESDDPKKGMAPGADGDASAGDESAEEEVVGELEDSQPTMSQPKVQFQNESFMAKSNLKSQKAKTFNFGLAADFSESDREEEEQPQLDFYQKETGAGAPVDEDEEMNLHLMNNPQKKVNPLSNKFGATQELQPSQIRKNKQKALKLKLEADAKVNNFFEADNQAPALLTAMDTEQPNASEEKPKRAFQGMNRNRVQKQMMVKKNFKPIGIDTDAINELYTYGGEQGKKKESLENELMDFENGILELANQCLAAMSRQPTDLVEFGGRECRESVKKSFEQKFQVHGDQEDLSGNEGGGEVSGDKDAAEGDDNKTNHFRPNFNMPQTMRGIKHLALGLGKDIGQKIEQITESDEENEPEAGAAGLLKVEPKKKLQIIDYGIIDDQNCGPDADNKSSLAGKSEGADTGPDEHAATKKNDEMPGTDGDVDMSQQSSEDREGLELLEQFDNDSTTQELSNLYASCFEWILSRPISALNTQLMIDDYDKIQQPAALQLLMNLVGQSNNLLRQRALLDFFMLAQWDVQNSYILLSHQKFHSWLLDLMLPYQQYIDEQDENCRAVYDMGCKLHTLLLSNSCVNPEQEAFKKLNFISRYPLTVAADKRIAAEKLSRVLLINILSSLQPQLGSADKDLCAWQNFIHIIQLSEEMMYTCSRDPSTEDKKSINLNMSLLEWQRKYLLYIETGVVYQNGVSELQWAEWEILDTLFEGIELLYKKLSCLPGEEKSTADELQQYQTSTHIIQEQVYQSLERCYQTSQFDQDIQLLMRECLVGSQITPRGSNGIETASQSERESQTNGNKFSFPAARLKNLKLQFQASPAPQTGTGASSSDQKQQCLVDSIMNILCTALAEAQTKDMTAKWLRKLEQFMRYIMLLSETLSQSKEAMYLKVQQKFSCVITFGFAFLFNRIHSAAYTQKQSPNRTQNLQLASESFQSSSFLKTANSNNSSPKDYQATNRLFSLTLKSLVIFFVNIVDYKHYCQEHGSSNGTLESAIWHVFSRILVNKFADRESQLISVEDIKRYKATNFEDFPECFGHEDWKVTFFHNKVISQIVTQQMSQEMVEELFQRRRQTYGKGINDMNARGEKTKEDMQRQIHADTNLKINSLSEVQYHEKVKRSLQMHAQGVNQIQKHQRLSKNLRQLRGMWRNSGPSYYKATNQGYSGFGIKSFLKESDSNSLQYIKCDKQLENRLFKHIEPKEGVVQPKNQKSDMFKFFGTTVTAETILEKKEEYVQFVKQASGFNKNQNRELIQTNCILMKPFYQNNGVLTLTAEEILFIYIDQTEPGNQMFFKKPQHGRKLWKMIDLGGIREVQKRRFMGTQASLEIFMLDNSSYLLRFEKIEERDGFTKKLLKQRGLKCQNLRYYDSFDPKKIIKKRELTDRWRQWRISNFNYLMQLNYLGGRSMNDLSQYPVLPWILSDQSFQNPQLELSSQTLNQHYQRGNAPPPIFRDLSKNMQLLGTAERQAEFKRKFEDTDGFLDASDRFHCGSHYSNPGIVLHYLARVSPFIDALVELQGMNHDNPDRIFHSLHDSYSNAMKDFSDVREILPEFYFLPEMYLNSNKLNFGRRQDREVVNDVVIPKQFEGNPYKFVVAMREALESTYASQNLSKWVDYIFGFKQQGPDAERSLNTFSNVTYEDKVDLEKLAITDPSLAESYKLQMYNYGQTPTQLLQFKTGKEHPPKKYKEEIFKYNLVTDQNANLKVYRPVNKKKTAQESNKAQVFAQLYEGKLPVIQAKAIIKAQFINEGLIAAARADGKMRFYMWVNQANDMNPSTPFTCGKEKKRLYDYVLSSVILQNDWTIPNLNKPMLILNRGKIILAGGHWDGQLTLSHTHEVQQDEKRQRSNSQQFSASPNLAQISAHSSTITVIASTIEDPNKIISKNQQSAQPSSVHDNAIVVTGSKAGDMIIWKFISETNELRKEKHFYDHSAQITSIFIHQDIQYLVSSSQDGSCNLYNLLKLKLIRVFYHPCLSPLTAVVVSCQPLACLAMFSPEDHCWNSFSINNQNLNDLENDKKIVEKNYHEESNQIVGPKVIQNAQFMDKLIYGTERGYLVIRDLPFMSILKRINISTNNIIQPVLTFIISKDRRFLLVGCGEGGLTVITEPFSNMQAKPKPRQRIQGQAISASQSNQSNFGSKTQVTLASGSTKNTNQSNITSNQGFASQKHADHKIILSSIKNVNQSFSSSNKNSDGNSAQQNVNFQIRQSIDSKKLVTKMSGLNPNYYGQNASIQKSKQISAKPKGPSVGGKLRINTSSGNQRQYSSGKPQVQINTSVSSAATKVSGFSVEAKLLAKIDQKANDPAQEKNEKGIKPYNEKMNMIQ